MEKEQTKLEIYKKVEKRITKKEYLFVIPGLAITIFGLVTQLVFVVFLGVGVCLLIIPFNYRDKRYLESHCKYCGESLYGCEYGWHEIKRSITGAGQERSLNSKIELYWTCPYCGLTDSEKKTYSSKSGMIEIEGKILSELRKRFRMNNK